MENHNFSRENPLFLWPFSIAMLVHQRVFWMWWFPMFPKSWMFSPKSHPNLHPFSIGIFPRKKHHPARYGVQAVLQLTSRRWGISRPTMGTLKPQKAMEILAEILAEILSDILTMFGMGNSIYDTMSFHSWDLVGTESVWCLQVSLLLGCLAAYTVYIYIIQNYTQAWICNKHSFCFCWCIFFWPCINKISWRFDAGTRSRKGLQGWDTLGSLKRIALMMTTVVKNPCWFMIGLRVITVIQFQINSIIYIYILYIYIIFILESIIIPLGISVLSIGVENAGVLQTPNGFYDSKSILDRRFRAELSKKRVASTGIGKCPILGLLDFTL